MTTVVEQNRHRRPGVPGLATAPHRLPVAAVELPQLTVAEVAELGERLRASVRASVRLSEPVLDVVVAVLLAGGHLLIEDNPGVGKTQLARTLAASLGGSFARVQATVVLVDELTRATPKTQSGLLEAMGEGQVSVDGRSWPLPRPFVVLATQNPLAGNDGTY